MATAQSAVGDGVGPGVGLVGSGVVGGIGTGGVGTVGTLVVGTLVGTGLNVGATGGSSQPATNTPVQSIRHVSPKLQHPTKVSPQKLLRDSKRENETSTKQESS